MFEVSLIPRKFVQLDESKIQIPLRARGVRSLGSVVFLSLFGGSLIVLRDGFSQAFPGYSRVLSFLPYVIRETTPKVHHSEFWTPQFQGLRAVPTLTPPSTPIPGACSPGQQARIGAQLRWAHCCRVHPAQSCTGHTRISNSSALLYDHWPSVTYAPLHL